jgi:flagellar motor switch/type III secretory pathway protein FliN
VQTRLEVRIFVKKTVNQDANTANENSKNGDKKNSLFDESFFDEDDDDFDFEDDDDEIFPDEDLDQTQVKNRSEASGAVGEVPATLSENANHETQNTTQSRTNEIQFRLGCELGQVLIPFENLQNLNIGSVVDFNNTLQTLYLSVNNVRVGEGMLVDVDGKIGIKITSWYGKL